MSQRHTHSTVIEKCVLDGACHKNTHTTLYNDLEMDFGKFMSPWPSEGIMIFIAMCALYSANDKLRWSYTYGEVLLIFWSLNDN